MMSNMATDSPPPHRCQNCGRAMPFAKYPAPKYVYTMCSTSQNHMDEMIAWPFCRQTCYESYVEIPWRNDSTPAHTPTKLEAYM